MCRLQLSNYCFLTTQKQLSLYVPRSLTSNCAQSTAYSCSNWFLVFIWFWLNFMCFKHTFAGRCLSTSLETAWSEGLDRECKAFTSDVFSAAEQRISNIMEQTKSREEVMLPTASQFRLNNFIHDLFFCQWRSFIITLKIAKLLVTGN